MTTWLADHWYFFAGIGGGLLLLAFYAYARRHPQGFAMSLWQRMYYTAAASAVVGGICVLITRLFFPSALSVFLSPVFPFALLAVMWIAAPYIRRWLALEGGQP